jgi:hypothetical protein
VHAIFYTKHVAEVHAFLRDVLELPFVDAGNGRFMYAAPPTELAVHDTDGEPGHELWLICDDITATVAHLQKKGVKTSEIADRGWGLVSMLELPGGDALGLYEPKHPSPLWQ